MNSFLRTLMAIMAPPDRLVRRLSPFASYVATAVLAVAAGVLVILPLATANAQKADGVGEQKDAESRQWNAEHGLIGTFMNGDRTIEETKRYTVRGVINVVHFPIPDGEQHGSEQGSVTGGYFLLFTPERYTFNGQEADERVQIKDQQMFQLAPDYEQVAKIEAALGKPVEMEVEPFIRNTMYHHTPVLFMVSSFKVIEGAATGASPASSTPSPSPSPATRKRPSPEP